MINQGNKEKTGKMTGNLDKQEQNTMKLNQSIHLTQFRILEWFLKDHVTLKTGLTAAKYSALPKNKLHFKIPYLLF